MNRVLLLLPLVALVACNSPRRGHTIRVAGCVEGRVAPCTCSSGISGTQICLADNQFTACDCPEVSDGGLDEDAGFDQDGGFIPDKDAGLDGSIDTGVPDTGFDSGVPDTGFDSGVPDTGFDSGVPDTGFDSGVPDTGFPQLDGGFNLDGGIPPIPDGGIPLPDGGLGGLCQLLPELGASCTQDVDCNTIIPFGLLFCRGNVCVEGCLCDNGPVCQSPLTCDPASGRCI